jgi:hypothetical protein
MADDLYMHERYRVHLGGSETVTGGGAWQQ